MQMTGRDCSADRDSKEAIRAACSSSAKPKQSIIARSAWSIWTARRASLSPDVTTRTWPRILTTSLSQPRTGLCLDTISTLRYPKAPPAFQLRYRSQLRRALITALSRGYDWIPLAPSSLLISCPAQSSQAGTFGSGVRLAVMLEPQCRDNFVIDAGHDWRQVWGSCRSSAAVVPQGGAENREVMWALHIVSRADATSRILQTLGGRRARGRGHKPCRAPQGEF